MKKGLGCCAGRSLLAVALAALLLGGCSRGPDRFQEGPVDLSGWTAVNYGCPKNGQPRANWDLSEDKMSVTQLVNADASIFVSDRGLDYTSINGTWLVDTSDDDDFMGFVFGYQGPGRFYLFDWKGARQSDSRVGVAKKGMAIKVVDLAYRGAAAGDLEPGKPFDGKELWQTEGAPPGVRLLHYEPTEGWQSYKPYRFQLDFRPGSFRIVVKDEDRVLLDKTLRDSTYRTGRFGFYNYSQGRVTYKGFAATRIPGGGQVLGAWIVVIIVLVVIVIIIAIVASRKKPRPQEMRDDLNDTEFTDIGPAGAGKAHSDDE